MRMVSASQRGNSLHSTAPSPSCLAHADTVCYTRGPDSWKQGARGTPHAVKRGAVSGVPPGRDERRNVVEARA